jgi:hypothetical protein
VSRTRWFSQRAAISLALERKFLLLIDDWRPYEAAQEAGVEVVNSLATWSGFMKRNGSRWSGRYMRWLGQRAAEL